MVLEFEWDENKNQQNIQKHGISFDEAKEIFNGDYFQIPSKKNQENTEPTKRLEKRYIAVGKYEPNIYISIIYTPRKNRIRIISARRAKNKEIKLLIEQSTN